MIPMKTGLLVVTMKIELWYANEDLALSLSMGNRLRILMAIEL